MIGNDLVYLPTWPKREGGRLQRFRTKVFTEAEREFITLAENPHLAEAWLWSCKEAAYKVWFKSSHKREFAPKKFKVESSRLKVQSSKFKVEGSKFKVETQAPLGLDADVCQAEAPCRLKRLHLKLGQEARVRAFEQQYYLYSTLEGKYIHTLASDQSLAEVRECAVYQNLFRPKSLKLRGKTYPILKTADNIPTIDHPKLNVDLSISHDGDACFTALVCS